MFYNPKTAFPVALMLCFCILHCSDSATPSQNDTSSNTTASDASTADGNPTNGKKNDTHGIRVSLAYDNATLRYAMGDMEAFYELNLAINYFCDKCPSAPSFKITAYRLIDSHGGFLGREFELIADIGSPQRPPF